ncbi:40929_t:CDS:1 [Gigaspora margarita]|uniref:40929_t:CDS:1 n=1 Tax=Gigaspora margarita TaxID=4874 RepID=A0ABN7UZQ4_GIGMA|nr:40929_t:CDS:1 [Gigaspora margarita]
MSFNCGNCNGETLPNVQPSDFEIISQSKIDSLTLIFYKDNLIYYVECMGRSVKFIPPTVDDALKIGGGKKKPPTSFILFRKFIQECVSSLGLRIPRDKLSKHIKQIWQDLKKKIPQLERHFQDVTRKALRQYNKFNLRIQQQTYPRSTSSDNTKINVNHSNADSHDINNLIHDLFPAIL